MRIVVDPNQLLQGAKKIRQESSKYQQSYQRLLLACSEMKQHWQGKDNQEFTRRIEGFEEDFKKMHYLMEEYAKFLKTSANIYQKTQEERMNLARKLTN